MTSIRRSRKALLGLAAFASVAAVLPFTNSAQALPPGTAPAGTAVLSPASGNNLTSGFQIQLPADTSGPAAGLPARCPGDGVNGHRWHTYIIPITSDPASTTYAGGVPVGPAVSSNLRNPSGTFIRNQLPGTGDGLIAQPPAGYTWVGLGAGAGILPAGGYNIGIACTLDVAGVTEVQKFWNTQITVTSTGATTFNYATGVVPAAPVLTTSSYDAGTTTATVNFTHAASLPATSGYTATITGSPAIAPIPVPAGATSFQIPGVALGSSYTVSLVASNTVGDSAPSNTITVVGAVTAPAPVVTAPDAFEGNAVTVSWLAPASGPAPASYDVAITPGGPTFTGVAGLSQVVPAGLAIGSYTATVTPNYAAGSGVTGTAGSDGFSVTPNTLVLQEITVTRPPGALILTQRCGVYGPLDAFTAVDAFPGFPRNLALETASADQIGTSPDIDLVTPGVQVDPEFGNYPEPQPPTYPTECGLSMGSARFVTSGALAGQFYTASGRLNQVTVLDTRDTDTGWIARGDVEDNFTGTTGNTFSGDYLGWTPQVTDTSDPVGGSTYDQVVTPGPQVLPGTPSGLTNNPILGESPVNAGLGIATMDARMKLLIPASANAADYSATLSLTVVPRP